MDNATQKDTKPLVAPRARKYERTVLLPPYVDGRMELQGARLTFTDTQGQEVFSYAPQDVKYVMPSGTNMIIGPVKGKAFSVAFDGGATTNTLLFGGTGLAAGEVLLAPTAEWKRGLEAAGFSTEYKGVWMKVAWVGLVVVVALFIGVIWYIVKHSNS